MSLISGALGTSGGNTIWQGTINIPAEINGSKLKNGHTKSCGCLSKEITSEMSRTHGMSDTRLYRIYKKMYRRCYKPKTKSFENYGGRGITICTEWLGEHGFENFAKWSTENGYNDNLSIDRKDNDKGYSPENCRWVNYKDQGNNRSTCHYILYKYYVFPITIWGEIINVNRYTLWDRFNKGWSTENALRIFSRMK